MGEFTQFGREHIQKPAANTFNNERLRTLPLRSGTRQKYLLSHILV